MQIEHSVSLAPMTTLGIGGPAKRFARVTSDSDLAELLAEDDRVLVMGGGSNLVIGDAGFDGLVVQIATRGTSVQIEDDRAIVIARAGTPWDDFVAEMIEAGFAGVECLSGIPGLVGATPMQNVGAYGQEVSDTIGEVRVYDHEQGRDVMIANADCAFGYRTSMFRGSTRWIVLDVLFDLQRSPLSAPIRYAELAKALGIPEGERAPLARVRETVIALRRGKGMVIDPTDPESRSAGSFFTNPIVDAATVAALDARFGSKMPRWPQPDGRTKLSAGWLIEQAGFAKGYTVGPVGISKKHALALVNRGGATTAQLLALARQIQDGVRAQLGVDLVPEPVIVS
jgi:UDP-N-acetylmuramate dehydrogenase